VVVVDFWTSGCISCIHILATSKKIEARFSGQPVVVIGIHRPKFDAAPAQRPRHHHARREPARRRGRASCGEVWATRRSSLPPRCWLPALRRCAVARCHRRP